MLTAAWHNKSKANPVLADVPGVTLSNRIQIFEYKDKLVMPCSSTYTPYNVAFFDKSTETLRLTAFTWQGGAPVRDSYHAFYGDSADNIAYLSTHVTGHFVTIDMDAETLTFPGITVPEAANLCFTEDKKYILAGNSGSANRPSRVEVATGTITRFGPSAAGVALATDKDNKVWAAYVGGNMLVETDIDTLVSNNITLSTSIGYGSKYDYHLGFKYSETTKEMIGTTGGNITAINVITGTVTITVLSPGNGENISDVASNATVWLTVEATYKPRFLRVGSKILEQINVTNTVYDFGPVLLANNRNVYYAHTNAHPFQKLMNWE